ncbi:MAG TPA: hypothetical protein VMT30_01300 [Candidatus Saccharimonadia bacterium]|nr:hypothetical protein [Candidatus Saccharimonadia bacterium]
MPAPLIHMVYAQAYVRDHPDLDEAAVVRGSAFPDIRLLAGLPRSLTHREGVTMDDVRHEEDAWRVGMLLHSYLDEAWNQFFREQGLGLLPETDVVEWRGVKAAEQADYALEGPERQRLAAMFAAPANAQELAVVASAGGAAVVGQWNQHMIWILGGAYEPEAWKREALKLGTNVPEAERIIEVVGRIRQSGAWRERVAALHRYLGI